MESNLASESVNRRVSGVATVVEYASAKEEIVGSNIIAVSTPSSSLSTVSKCFLGAKLKQR
jgi:hypothetical protein